ncbi:MAG: hypothetical protein LQ337_007600, partial [Flavoplaca oasis]
MRIAWFTSFLFPYVAELCSVNLSPQANCTSCLPNPIATTYPNNITGTINATTSVILVPLSYARSLLPSRFANSILTNAYTRFNISPTLYPLVVESVIDHDIRFNNSPVLSDFSSFRTTFPFINLLGDGYSTFRYTGFIYLPPSNPIAINGSQGYGYTVLPGYFDPPDAPYKYTRNGRARSFTVFEQTSNSTPSTSHYGLASSRLAGSTLFRTTSSQPPIPLSFYRNITNQIAFGNNSKVCDRMISFWNTSITTGAYEPQAVVGDVLLSPPLVPERK